MDHFQFLDKTFHTLKRFISFAIHRATAIATETPGTLQTTALLRVAT